ncbi:MAG: ATP-binding protein [Gammaproteobacteria bacterium]|nr:ATP-binding protein [Gammaproteobacteria bacterium]
MRTILIIRLLLVTFILVGSGSWMSYATIQHETQELFDAQLSRSARLILSLAQVGRNPLELSSIQLFLDQNKLKSDHDPELDEYIDDDEELANGHVYETKLGFQIWDDAGNLVLKSTNLPITDISAGRSGFSDHYFSDYEWRVFSLTSIDGRYRCITAERIDVRNELIEEVSEGLLQLFLILVPVLSIVMWFAINQGLAPLQKLTSQIKSRSADKLDSITSTNTPAEIKTITEAVNQLLSRLKNALAREKRITSDAAHELRTPLSAVKLHAELARKADNASDRITAIDQVMRGIDRSTHLVNQLLALARLEPEKFSQQLERIDIGKILVEETALLAPIAEDKNLELSITDNDHVIAPVDETSLRLLIRNLLSNAISYTPDGGAISLSLINDERQFRLIVEDNGPGIPEEERDRVLERYYRLQNHQETGCGIGLSIVTQVVELHQATLSMETPEKGSGLRVVITFPNQSLSVEA